MQSNVDFLPIYMFFKDKMDERMRQNIKENKKHQKMLKAFKAGTLKNFFLKHRHDALHN